MAVSPDGQRIASGSFDETIRFWDAGTEAILCRSSRSFGGAWALAWSHDGRWLATDHQNGKVRVWDSATGRLKETLAEHREPIQILAWGPWANWEGDTPNEKRAYYDIKL